jgi:hypothetical protein
VRQLIKVFILSNNPKVWNEYKVVMKVDGSLRDVLLKVRDYVHQGYKILSHPLAGSVKPNETPFKSVLMDAEPGAIDFNSLRIIESAIEITDKFVNLNRKWEERVIEDFQLIDNSLLEAAFEHFPPNFKLVKID